MTLALPEGLSVGFVVAVAELGMASAARLFVEEIAAVLGPEGVSLARDSIGREFAVFDSVASHFIDAGSLEQVDAAPVLAELTEVRRVLVVGMEADALDAIVPALRVPIGLMAGGAAVAEDVARNAANYPGRVEVVALDGWASWAGAKSALLTFVYGADDHVANVSPAYLRLVGPDVRSAFRSLVGWNLLGPRPRLHPRYLAETSLNDFSVMLPSERAAS